MSRPSRPAYHRDAYQTEVEALVVEVLDLERLEIVLDDTVLYPEGGGQPSDRGQLRFGERTVSVDHVRKTSAGYAHRVDARRLDEATSLDLVGRPCLVSLDWYRRFDHMQQHTAQHLLSAIAEDRHGWKTTAFHLGEGNCDVELATTGLSSAACAELEEEVNAEVRAARRVSARWVAPELLLGVGSGHEAEPARQIAVRSRGLPEDHRGDVRLVEIECTDVNTCGGTHLRSTAEVESIKLLGAEEMRGGTRLAWIAGARVRSRLARHEERAAQLRRILEGSDDEVAGLAQRKKEQLMAAQKRLAAVSEPLVSSWLEEALASSEEVAVRVVEPLEPSAVSSLARGYARRAAAERPPRSRALVVVSSQGVFAIATVPELDAQSLGRAAAELCGGRGGGKGPVFQGKGSFGDPLPAGSQAPGEAARAAARFAAEAQSLLISKIRD